MAKANELLSVARKELGNTESPAGSNRTKYGKWFGYDGAAWCMMFVMWVFAQVGVKLPKRTASCGDLMRAAQAEGCWVTRNFQPGDVVIYDFPGGAATDHCGIVEMEIPGYGVQAIEGNTSVSGSQSNGGMVCRRNRPSGYIVGAVRPQFDEEEDDMDINAMISQMTDAQAYALMEKAQRHAATLPAPDWIQEELQEAMDRDITDGSRPMGLVMRYEAGVMAKRAAAR